jgi:hypothetical protein
VSLKMEVKKMVAVIYIRGSMHLVWTDPTECLVWPNSGFGYRTEQTTEQELTIQN